MRQVRRSLDNRMELLGSIMTALPRVHNAQSWRQRAEVKEKSKRNSSHERHMQALAVANQLRTEKGETMSNTYQVRSWLDAVHSISDRAENGIGFFLDKLEQSGQSGWSPETLHMIHLKNNARTLRQLADRMDRELEQMTAGYVPFLQAAE